MVAFVIKGVYDFQKIALLGIWNLYQYSKSDIYSYEKIDITIQVLILQRVICPSQIFTLVIVMFLDIVIDAFSSKLE